MLERTTTAQLELWAGDIELSLEEAAGLTRKHFR
jgi:hypothetical protein